jgi:hypothetical protein
VNVDVAVVVGGVEHEEASERRRLPVERVLAHDLHLLRRYILPLQPLGHRRLQVVQIYFVAGKVEHAVLLGVSSGS